jgi:hypothetical protein
MPKYHLLRSYSKLPDGRLGEFGLSIAGAMDGNANFTTPSTSPAALTTQSNTFIASAATALDGTTEDTAAKKALRAALINTLDQLADYVELTAQNDPVKLASSGFRLASTNTSTAIIGTTAIIAVTNVASTKLGLEFQIDPNAWLYEVEISTTPGVWVHAGIFTDPHDAVLTGLTPGTAYQIRARLMGSRNQIGEWCSPVSAMST